MDEAQTSTNAEDKGIWLAAWKSIEFSRKLEQTQAVYRKNFHLLKLEIWKCMMKMSRGHQMK